MHLFTTAYSLALLTTGLSAASSPINAVSCTDYNPTVLTPADLENLSQCSTMAGNIAISGEFSGIFSLPGIELIGNTLYSVRGHDLSGITEFSMPDLIVVIEAIDLVGLSGVRKFQMPKLYDVGSGAMKNNPSPALTRFTNTETGTALDLSFPELERLSMTMFTGNIRSIDMPKLKVARSMWINSTAELDCNALIAQLKDVDFRDGKLECHSSANINKEGGREGLGSDAPADQLPLGNI